MSAAEPVSQPGPESGPEALNSSTGNGTVRFTATPEGTALAYGSLLLMALLPIFFGALRSVRCSKSKVRFREAPGPRSGAVRAGGGAPLTDHNQG